MRIDAAGKRQIEVIPPAKTFFLASFPEFMPQTEVPDTLIQRQLLSWMKESSEKSSRVFPFPGMRSKGSSDTSRPSLAQICLLCFISSQIERTCQKLAVQFGTEHGFTVSDLLPFVLDYDGRQPLTQSSYQSLLHEILQSFDPEQSSLATWTTRLVKQHKELNAFLLEHGVYLVSDWAILNDTRPKQLQRIFSQFYHLTPVEIQQATRLLESYHAVYRAQRLKQGQAGIKCLPPTTAQLQQMAQRLATQTTQVLSPPIVMAQLQEMASRLREYRIHVRGGSLPTESLDVKNSNTSGNSSPSLELVDIGDNPDEPAEFLSVYREQFLHCLDEAIAQVASDRIKTLQRQNTQKAHQFITAIELFHCQDRSMGEIAQVLNLQAQFQVTRLLKLKALRADVRQQLLLRLRDRVFQTAQAYTDLQHLQTLNHQIEAALEEQIDRVIQEAESEAKTAKRVTTSLFAQRVCHYLHTRRTQP
ncbi:MAG TPA: hypothetical protein V6C95_11135 [Coleofasciculaceae cyanobacterium]